MIEHNGWNLEMEEMTAYTRISNLILEALGQASLNRTQYHICNFILRRTYGWHRNYDAIPLSDFAVACNTSKQNISRQVAALVRMRIIRRLIPNEGGTFVYAFVPDPARWDRDCIDPTALAASQQRGVFKCTPQWQLDLANMREEMVGDDVTCRAQSRESYGAMTGKSHPDMTGESHADMTGGSHQYMTLNQTQSMAVSAVEPILKKDLKKGLKTYKENKTYPLDSIECELSELLYSMIKENLPHWKRPDMQKWCADMDMMIRVDKRSPYEVSEVILFCQSDPFWSGQILSVKSLRRKYDQLNSIMHSQQNRDAARMERERDAEIARKILEEDAYRTSSAGSDSTYNSRRSWDMESCEIESDEYAGYFK